MSTKIAALVRTLSIESATKLVSLQQGPESVARLATFVALKCNAKLLVLSVSISSWASGAVQGIAGDDLTAIIPSSRAAR